MAEGRWTIVGSSTDRAAIDTLAQYLMSKQVPCQLSEPSSSIFTRYSLLVPQRFADQLDELMEWVSVAEYSDPTSARVTAGLLGSEGLPVSCDQPSRFNMGPFHVSVPRSLKQKAKEILDAPPISDAELTELALGRKAAKGHNE